MTLPLNIRGFAFSADSAPRPIASLEEIVGATTEKRYVWLDVEGEPGAENEAWLKDRLDWHPIVLQNIKQSSSRARLTLSTTIRIWPS